MQLVLERKWKKPNYTIGVLSIDGERFCETLEDVDRNLSDDNRARLEEITERNNELEKEVAELRKQVLNLTMNICMDLTCSNRTKEITKRNGKNKSRLDETTSPSRGGC